MAESASCGLKLLPHDQYSPDLASSDFVLFPKLKSELRGRHSRIDDDVIHAVEAYLQTQDASYFQEAIGIFECRGTKFLEDSGNYAK